MSYLVFTHYVHAYRSDVVQGFYSKKKKIEILEKFRRYFFPLVRAQFLSTKKKTRDQDRLGLHIIETQFRGRGKKKNF